jgi:hypothetical protein
MRGFSSSDPKSANSIVNLLFNGIKKKETSEESN